MDNDLLKALELHRFIRRIFSKTEGSMKPSRCCQNCTRVSSVYTQQKKKTELVQYSGKKSLPELDFTISFKSFFLKLY